jgi:hypothetical protein
VGATATGGSGPPLNRQELQRSLSLWSAGLERTARRQDNVNDYEFNDQELVRDNRWLKLHRTPSTAGLTATIVAKPRCWLCDGTVQLVPLREYGFEYVRPAGAAAASQQQAPQTPPELRAPKLSPAAAAGGGAGLAAAAAPATAASTKQATAVEPCVVVPGPALAGRGHSGLHDGGATLRAMASEVRQLRQLAAAQEGAQRRHEWEIERQATLAGPPIHILLAKPGPNPAPPDAGDVAAAAAPIVNARAARAERRQELSELLRMADEGGPGSGRSSAGVESSAAFCEGELSLASIGALRAAAAATTGGGAAVPSPEPSPKQQAGIGADEAAPAVAVAVHAGTPKSAGGMGQLQMLIARGGVSSSRLRQTVKSPAAQPVS